MIKIENVETLGWEAAVRGMRNPMNSWEKSDSDYRLILCKRCDNCISYKLERWDDCKNCEVEKECDSHSGFMIGPNDLDLMIRLVNAGIDHRKFMRMIVVYCDITAPLYWWKEFDTYKVGTVANSCSTMHKIADKEFTHEDFSINKLAEITGADLELLDEYRNLGDMESVRCDLARYRYNFNIDDTIFNLNFARSLYMAADKNLKRGDLTDDEKKRITAQKKKFWWQMIQLLPSSYNQKRTVMLNYEVIANMYRSRKNHKLDEWVELMTYFKENLPYSELFTGE